MEMGIQARQFNCKGWRLKRIWFTSQVKIHSTKKNSLTSVSRWETGCGVVGGKSGRFVIDFENAENFPGKLPKSGAPPKRVPRLMRRSWRLNCSRRCSCSFILTIQTKPPLFQRAGWGSFNNHVPPFGSCGIGVAGVFLSPCRWRGGWLQTQQKSNLLLLLLILLGFAWTFTIWGHFSAKSTRFTTH